MTTETFHILLILFYPFALALINSEKIDRLRKRIEELESAGKSLPSTCKKCHQWECVCTPEYNDDDDHMEGQY